MKLDKVRIFAIKTQDGVEVYKTNCPNLVLRRILEVSKNVVKSCLSENEEDFKDCNVEDILKDNIFDEIENSGYEIDQINLVGYVDGELK